MQRKRSWYILLLIVTVFAGLASRRYGDILPMWIADYAGDTLWTVMVYLVLAIIFHRQKPIRIALATLLISFAVEISQLYHAEWIDAIRNTWLGGIILGFGFLWSDLICYTVGAGLAFVLEVLFFGKNSQ